MNVLNRLSEELVKNGVKGKSQALQFLLPKEFTLQKKFDGANTTKKSKNAIVVPRDTSKFVRENIHLVGRGSNYQKKQVQEFLEPLKPYKLKRQEINNDYDQEKSIEYTKFTINKRRKEKSGFGLSEDFLGEVLAALVRNLPESEHNLCDNAVEGRNINENYDNSNNNSKNIHRKAYIYPKFTNDEVPEIPNFEQNPEKFDAYIGLLTHSKFYYRNSSKTNGIIPKILRSLFHPANVKTFHLRTVNSYNDLIYFFSKKFDFATCRELLVQMKVENIKPNTKTYNLLIMNVLKNSQIRKSKSIRPELKIIFKDMEKYKVKVDEYTWNICFNFLNNDLSKDIYIEQMVKHGVPITSDFLYTVFRNNEKYKSADILKYLASNKIPITDKLFAICIDKLIAEDKIKIAWEMINFTLKAAKYGNDLKINFNIIDKLLINFAKRGRIDLTLLTLNKFLYDHKLTPTPDTFEMSFKSLNNSGYCKNFSIIYKYLLDLKAKYGHNKYKTYWTVKCDSIIKFNCNKVFSKDETHRGTSLLENFKFPDNNFVEFTWYVKDKDSNNNFRKTLRYIGCTLSKVQKPFKEPTGPDKKKLNYRKRLKYVAIQKSMVNKIQYSQDYYGKLREELNERGIVN